MDSQVSPEAPKAQPKISQKMLLRFAIGLFIMTGLFLAYRWWSGVSKDPTDIPLEADTGNLIGAIQLLDEGSQAVVVKPDGEVRLSPGYAQGKTDRDLVWRPDGNRLFFVSDREDDSYLVYRWNLASDAVAKRSIGTRSQADPSFAPPGSPEANEKALITAGGFVLECDPRDVTTRQILPPVGKEIGGGDEGSAGQFEQLYQRIGTSFRVARYGKDKKFVAAVMRREDEGEILIVQSMEKVEPPLVIMAGKHIDFDVNPISGEIAFAVNGFFFHDPRSIPPEVIKNGKVELPFANVVGLFDPEAKSMKYVMPTREPDYGFRNVQVSPDGSMLLVVAGKLDANANFEPEDLVVVPARDRGGEEARRLLHEKVFDPSWHPNSHTIAFCKYNDAKKRAIFRINKDGSGYEDVTKDKGDFATPMFSPKSK